MQTRAVQITFTLICLVLAAAAQELVPAFGGAKTPFLALFAVYTALRPSRSWMPAALAAGAFEDALNGSPTPCCTFFTLLVRFFASALPAVAAGALVFAALPAAERLIGFTLPAAGRRQR